MQTVEFFLALVALFASYGFKDPETQKSDVVGAFRLLPVEATHLKYAVTATHRPDDERPWLLQHFRMPFGATASVEGWCRL